MRWELAWKEPYLAFQLSDPPSVFSLYKLVLVGFAKTVKILMIHLLIVKNLEMIKDRKILSIYNPNTYIPSYIYGIYMYSYLFLCVCIYTHTHIYTEIFKNTFIMIFLLKL